MAKAEYRSSIRSKNLIKKALAKLIHEKDLSKITVSDIIREADISRGTFYAHFSDVSSVVTQIESEEMNSLMVFVDKYGFENICTQPKNFIVAICEYMMKDIEYYRMLAMSNILNNFIWRLVNVYYEKLLERVLTLRPEMDRNEAEVYLIYITSGAKTTILSWLNGEIKCAPEEIGERLGKLIMLSQTYIEQ
ncbi:MAG: TetR/AcrR family transcriptional regulator C-terminal domain-containing protein [Clostridia bacterium]|nr:TetR/AcrR family transcriptional regulator C-terminal domain-containing protein [Clostridia bacterium]